MKIRDPITIRRLSWVGAKLIRLWMGTIHYQYRPLGPNLDPHGKLGNSRFIYAFWHEGFLLPLYHYARPDVHVLISTHADGQLISEVAHHLGFSTVRGSSTRGGAEAIRQMVRLSRSAHIAVTPDGPRGPRRQVQQGILYLAARTGLPIVPMGIGFRRAWRAKSWDRMAVPFPFSKGCLVTGDPIHIAPRKSSASLAGACEKIEKAMHAVTEVAERWAFTGKFDPAGYEKPESFRVAA